MILGKSSVKTHFRDEHKVALVGIDLALAMQKHAGDTISLLGEQFKIVGVTRFNSVINRNVVVVQLTDLQELTLRPNVVMWLVSSSRC